MQKEELMTLCKRTQHDEAVLAQQIRDGLELAAVSPEQIDHMVQFLLSVRCSSTAEPMTLTTFKRDPGRVIDQLRDLGVQCISSKHDDVMVVRSDDLKMLVEVIIEGICPRYATGHEVYTSLAHDWPASSVAQFPPRGRPHQTPAYHEALRCN
jgi:hypothetical protein